MTCKVAVCGIVDILVATRAISESKGLARQLSYLKPENQILRSRLLERFGLTIAAQVPRGRLRRRSNLAIGRSQAAARFDRTSSMEICSTTFLRRGGL